MWILPDRLESRDNRGITTEIKFPAINPDFYVFSPKHGLGYGLNEANAGEAIRDW